MDIDTETIATDAGDYTVRFILDETPEQPYDEGFSLHRRSSLRCLPFSTGDELPGYVSDTFAGHRTHSRTAIVRYMSLLGKKGVVMFDNDYLPDDPSTDMSDYPPVGIAWAPDDATNPDEYARSALATWRAWAYGDVFGYEVTAPDGEVVDSCWGFYEFTAMRAEILDEAANEARAHAAERIAASNLVGAGFVGIL